MKSRIRTSIVAAGIAAGLFAACNDRSAGGSDEIDTSVGRVAVDQDGKPVASARVLLFASGDSSGEIQAASRTDANGKYPSVAVPDGYYGILLRDSSSRIGRYIDSVQVVSEALPAGFDTLLGLGSIQGVVRLSEGHSPATAEVAILGTSIAAIVGSDGRFKLELVPGGIYTLATTTVLPNYGRVYKRLVLAEGQNLTLTDTIVIPFLGLPAPRGYEVTQDSLTGNVLLRWSRLVHPDLYGYSVQALEGGQIVRGHFVQDSFFVDTLSRFWEGAGLFGPWSDRKILYRVASKAAADSSQNSSAAPEFTAKPPAWTRSVRKPRLRFDTTSTEVRLVWDRIGHPALTGWTIARFVDGTPDCSKELGNRDTSWSDTACPDRTWKIVDSSGYTTAGTRRYLKVRQHPRTTWMLLADRGYESTIVDSVVTVDTGTSGDFTGTHVGIWNVDDYLESAGKWLVRTRYGSNGYTWISQDGVRWETVDKSGFAIGSGDSIAIARILSDSQTVVWETRTGEGKWTSDSIRLGFNSNKVMWGVFDKGDHVLALAREISTSTYHNYRLVRIHAGTATVLDSVIDGYMAGRYNMYPLPGQGWQYGFATAMPEMGFVNVDEPRLFPWSKSSKFVLAGMAWGEPVGPWNGGKNALFYTSNKLCLFDSLGNGRILEMPQGAGKPVVIGDVLWVPVGESLWKGTIR